jgi:DNA-binding CsgD family transcriptional regulator
MNAQIQTLRPPATSPTIEQTLEAVAWDIHSAQELADGESALDKIADALDMPWPCWVYDVSYPYFCPHQDSYSRKRDWPEALMDMWWNRHVALKMPFLIRCRVEHLPFVTVLNHKSRRPSARISREHQLVNELMAAMGITSMLTVPLHLPKGQIAMLTWGGNCDPIELNDVLGRITGHLLAVGHNFMRIYKSQIGKNKDSSEKRKSKHSSEERVRLTPREWDCLRTLAQGYRDLEIAEVTGISKATVRFHLDNVVEKFGCRDRIQAVAIAAQLGLLGPVGV